MFWRSRQENPDQPLHGADSRLRAYLVKAPGVICVMSSAAPLCHAAVNKCVPGRCEPQCGHSVRERHLLPPWKQHSCAVPSKLRQPLLQVQISTPSSVHESEAGGS